MTAEGVTAMSRDEHRHAAVGSVAKEQGFAWALGPAAAIAALFFLFNPQIVVDWRIYSFDDGTYSHAYLIPVMSAWLLYEGWKAGVLQLRWSWACFALLGISLLAYQWLEFAHQRYLARAAVPLCMTLALLCVHRVTRYTLLAGAMFWFVTPVWGPISEFLQWTSVKAVSFIMQFTGIPTFVYDEFVRIPAGTFEIADGCSGLRYVIAALALVAFYSGLYLRRYRSMLILALVALAGAMLTNWLRIAALILIGHFSDMQSSLIRDHNMFGWFLFVPLMVLIFFLAERLEPINGRGPGAVREKALALARPRANQIVLLGALLALVSGAALRTLAGIPAYDFAAEVDVEAAQPLQLPEQPAPQIYAASSYTAETLPGADDAVLYTIVFDGSSDAQRAEFYLNEMIPPGWKLRNSLRADGARELRIQRRGDLAVVRYSYAIGATRTGERGDLRLMRLRAATRLDRSSTLRWGFAPCNGDCERASALLVKRFP